MNRRLTRSITDRKIGGVAAGTATYFDIDPSISRVLWLLLAIFTGGVFVIVYLVMWAVVPEEPWQPPASPVGAPPGAAGATDSPEGEAAAATSTWSPSAEVRGGPGPHVIFGLILILIGAWFLADQFLPWLNFGTIWPIGLVVIGVIVLVSALRRGG